MAMNSFNLSVPKKANRLTTVMTKRKVRSSHLDLVLG